MAQRKSPLRVVAKDEKAKPERKLTVVQAVESGTEREILVASRRVVSKALDDPNVAARDLAALTRRLQELSKDIAALDAREQEAAEYADVQDGEFDASAI